MNIAFIPARCGSKSISLKNIQNFCDKPLIYWNLEALQKSKNIDRIYVSTDCKEIVSVVDDFNFSKVSIFERSELNASDIASTESAMLEFINENRLGDDSLFLLVQVTSPLTQTHDFDRAIEQYKNERADSLLTCVRSKRFFWKSNGTAINYDYQNRPRRQDFDGLLMENGAFYINTVANIKKSHSRISGRISIYEMEEFTAVEIDEKDDWIIAENMMQKYILNNKTKPSIKLFLSDVDGTLTDAGMYYGENGEEFKKFNTHDGKGFELLRKFGIKTGLITSEDTNIVVRRAKKIKVDYLFQGLEHVEKLDIVKEICKKEKFKLENVAYIGDDINCLELLKNVGLAACPKNSNWKVKNIINIKVMSMSGGKGAVREFIDTIIG